MKVNCGKSVERVRGKTGLGDASMSKECWIRMEILTAGKGEA